MLYAVMSASCECPLCNFSAPSRNLWLSHIRNVLLFFPLPVELMNVVVPIYTKCASFVSHVYRQHRDIIINQACTSACTDSDQSQLESVYEDIILPSTGTSEDRTSLQHAVDQIIIGN